MKHFEKYFTELNPVLSAISTMLRSGLFFSSCAVEEAPSGEGSILAVMENDDTRTAVTDEGKFTWSSAARGNYACGFDFTSTTVVLDTDARARGHSVRCVQDSEQESVEKPVEEVEIYFEGPPQF